MSNCTQNGNSALMMAAREGSTKVVSLLLEAGANIDLQNEVIEDNINVYTKKVVL